VQHGLSLVVPLRGQGVDLVHTLSANPLRAHLTVVEYDLGFVNNAEGIVGVREQEIRSSLPGLALYVG
jgi:hypothetical protein